MTYRMRGRSDVQTSQNVRCVLNKSHTRRRTATNFWLFWPTAWWMTAVSSSLMQETSTTPQRSSEVSAPVPSSLPRLPDIIVCLCLLGLCLRDPAQCVMLCSCGDSHNISSERTSIRAACPLTMLMQCVCVYPCTRKDTRTHTQCCLHCLCRQLQRISSDVVPSKKLLFKQEA